MAKYVCRACGYEYFDPVGDIICVLGIDDLPESGVCPNRALQSVVRQSDVRICAGNAQKLGISTAIFKMKAPRACTSYCDRRMKIL